MKNKVWHPFTQMKTEGLIPQLSSAKGSLLFGVNGEIIIDAISSWWVNLHGHCHPELVEALQLQVGILDQVVFAGFTHEPAEILAHKLTVIKGGEFEKVFFSDDGSTSVEVALKMSLQYWANKGDFNRTKIIAFENAYHGDTFGAMSVGGKSGFHDAFHSKLFEVIFIPFPSELNYLDSMDKFHSVIQSEDVAAFIYEPLVLGAAGMKMYSPEILNGFLEMAKSQSILCIADEVMTGFGRTGKLFASDYAKIQPDIICLSKGITGGVLPLGVTMTTNEIFIAFLDDSKQKAFLHGHSYTGNPISCAVAIANLQLLMSKSCQEQIEFISTMNSQFCLEHANVHRIENLRHQGTILAFDITTDERTQYFNHLRDKCYMNSLRQGVLLRPLGNVIYSMPPYCISKEELEKVYEVMLSNTKI